MKSRTVTLLAIGVVILFAAVYALNSGDRARPSADADLLLPQLKSALNDIDAVTITTADETITLRKRNGGWVVPEKGGFPADTAGLRTLLLALAEARKIEAKTSNPDLYERLGVQEPAAGGDGVLVSASSSEDGFTPVAVILGDRAQGEYRYARIPEEGQSWLIDRNPEAPENVAGWLSQDIVDIASSRIRSAGIRHADGETIQLYKESPEDNNFQVQDIPEARELSYPSVANGIAGVLGRLTLEDVREAAAGDLQQTATASFTTFDGLSLDVAVYREGSEDAGDTEDSDAATWITLEASAMPASAEAGTGADDDTATGSATAAETAGDGGASLPEEGNGAETIAADDAEEGDAAPAEPEATPQEEAAAINERVSGWQFRIADYKAQQLTREWNDLLSD